MFWLFLLVVTRGSGYLQSVSSPIDAGIGSLFLASTLIFLTLLLNVVSSDEGHRNTVHTLLIAIIPLAFAFTAFMIYELIRQLGWL